MPGVARFTAQAEADLLSIHAAIAIRSVAAANRHIRTTHAKCQLLADMPGIGARRDSLRKGMRLWTVGKHLIFYQIETDGILVVRVVWGRRDLRKIFP